MAQRRSSVRNTFDLFAELCQNLLQLIFLLNNNLNITFNAFDFERLGEIRQAVEYAKFRVLHYAEVEKKTNRYISSKIGRCRNSLLCIFLHVNYCESLSRSTTPLKRSGKHKLRDVRADEIVQCFPLCRGVG